jgi:hypothetical protein
MRAAAGSRAGDDIRRAVAIHIGAGHTDAASEFEVVGKDAADLGAVGGIEAADMRAAAGTGAGDQIVRQDCQERAFLQRLEAQAMGNGSCARNMRPSCSVISAAMAAGAVGRRELQM